MTAITGSSKGRAGVGWAALISLCSWDCVCGADTPTELLVCGQQCYEERPTGFVFDCSPTLSWTSAWGRNWFGPLRYVGPVEVSIQARPWLPPEQTLPLYIEIRADNSASCVSRSGALFWQTSGTRSCDVDSTWIRFPRTTLPLALGREYWIQLSGFYQALPIQLSSPFWGCLRVQAFPIDAVVARSWGTVKHFYQ